MTSAGRVLRSKKHRKVVEYVRQRKQLFTPEIKKLLKEWLVRRRRHPYPSRGEKRNLAMKTGLTYMQICNWFANWRRKLRRNTAGDGWGWLTAGYQQASASAGHCEGLSISSRDSFWDEGNYNHQTPSVSSPESSQASSRAPPLPHTCEPLWLSPQAARPATPALVKWLESAARFRPREASRATLCWGGGPPATSRRQTRPRVLRRKSRRHKEEMDAAVALTSLSAAMQGV